MQEGAVPTDPPISLQRQPIPFGHQSRFQHSLTRTFLLQKPLLLTPSVLLIRRDSSSDCALPLSLTMYPAAIYGSKYVMELNDSLSIHDLQLQIGPQNCPAGLLFFSC